MASTRGSKSREIPETETPKWEPEALELPLYVPVQGQSPHGTQVKEPVQRVVVIDLT